MTYIKLPHVSVDDERWLAAGADAFALHCAALVWCDRRLTDGEFPKPMVPRVALALPPERAQAAADALVEQAFWADEGAVYLLVDFLEHAFPAEQVKATRARWKADKDRRRQHSIGDHSLCRDPKFCPAVSTVESTVESTSGGSHLDKTQSDQTRPDRRKGSGDGRGNPSPAGAGPGAPQGNGPSGHHFVMDSGMGDDDPLLCLTCGLPPGNRRHLMDGHRWLRLDGDGIVCAVCRQPHEGEGVA